MANQHVQPPERWTTFVPHGNTIRRAWRPPIEVRKKAAAERKKKHQKGN